MAPVGADGDAARATIKDVGGTALVTADHGNVEKMRDEAVRQAHTAHTTGPAPLINCGTTGHWLCSRNALDTGGFGPGY